LENLKKLENLEFSGISFVPEKKSGNSQEILLGFEEFFKKFSDNFALIITL